MQGKSFFNLRSFTSFSLVLSTIIMSLSGFILYVAPAGRIANWGDWQLMLFTKAEWQALHTIFSYLFFILAVVHLFFVNWKTFLVYFKSKVKSGLNKKRELAASLIVSAIFFLGTLQSWAPFGSVMSFGEEVKGSWEKTYAGPPVAHMEEYTLTKLASDYPGITPQQLASTLTDSSIIVSNTDVTLKEIAALNKTIPSRIYDILNRRYKISAQDITRAPSGLGKMTVGQVAERLGKDTRELVTIMKENNLEITGETSMKTLSDQLGITPTELYAIFSGKGKD